MSRDEERGAPDHEQELARLRGNLAAQSSVAQVLAGAPSLEQAGPLLLDAIGHGLDWELGVLWEVDERAGVLRCRATWHDGGGAPAFERLSHERTFEPGVGLPGRVLEATLPESIPDVLADENFPRSAAAESDGLRGAFAFPICDADRVYGVVEFLSRRVRAPDEAALELAHAFGRQIGEYVWRTRVEEAARESEARTRGILESALDAIVTIDHRGGVVEFNPAAEQTFGYTRDEAIGREMAELIVPPSLREHHRRALARAVETGDGALLGRRVELIGMRAGGAEFPVELTIARLGLEDPPSFAGYVRDITDRKRAEVRSALLAETGNELSASLDLDSTLAAVSHLCIPQIADWCIVDLFGQGRGIERAVVAHADPAGEAVARELRVRPAVESSAAGIGKAIRTGRAELFPEVSDDVLVLIAQDTAHLSALRALGARSAMVVPLATRGQTLGAIFLLAAESGRRFDEEDLAFAREIARRAALAIDNARIHEERSSIAATLQASLLPPRLPRLPGVAVASRFRAAGEAHVVGGDFFDVFATGPGDWAIVVGDVSGKGPEAAAVTALARYTVREAAAHEELPSGVLSRLNEAILAYQAEGGDRFCTALVGRVRSTTSGARLILASGGHPLPLRLSAEGQVEPVGAPGMLLGIAHDPVLEDRELELAAGDSLLLYTDGVTETPTASGLLGERGLAALLENCRGLDAEALVERVDRTVVALQAGAPRDDIAMVALQVADPSTPGAGEAVRDHRLAALSGSSGAEPGWR